MQLRQPSIAAAVAVACSGWLWGCGDSEPEPGGNAGAPSTSGGTSGAGASSPGGSAGTGGAGVSGSGGDAGSAGTGGTGGSAGSSGANGSGGDAGSAGSAGSGGAAGASPCAGGGWPAADPAQRGPFMPATENNVGPNSAYTLFRPQDLATSERCHPVVTWGNGTGTTPTVYRTLLNHLASHGFVVIASNSENVARGTPPPMLDGVTWVLAQNETAGSTLYGRIDPTKIGATGHSQGAFATTSAGSDARITTIAPIQGARANRSLHGPALLLCGGMDTTVPCSGSVTAFNGISNQPVMYANLRSATHTNWIGFGGGGGLNPYVVAVTGWFRVQLMGDSALRSMFYGADCTLCRDTATWEIQRKMMD